MALAARSVIETEEWVVADSICLNVTYMGRQIRHATQLGSKSVFLSHHIDFLNLPCPGDAVAVNTAVWIDVRHGSYPNGWRIPCHWMDVMMPLMRAALQGALAGATDVFMWQVPRGKFVATGFHAGILRVLTAAAALRTPPRLHFSEVSQPTRPWLCIGSLAPAWRQARMQSTRVISSHVRADSPTRAPACTTGALPSDLSACTIRSHPEHRSCTCYGAEAVGSTRRH